MPQTRSHSLMRSATLVALLVLTLLSGCGGTAPVAPLTGGEDVPRQVLDNMRAVIQRGNVDEIRELFYRSYINECRNRDNVTFDIWQVTLAEGNLIYEDVPPTNVDVRIPLGYAAFDGGFVIRKQPKNKPVVEFRFVMRQFARLSDDGWVLVGNQHCQP